MGPAGHEVDPRNWLAYVPRHVAKELLRRPVHDLLGRGRRSEAVVLFADISGFTPMSETLSRAGRQGTEELSLILNEYFETMTGLVDAYGGSVGKFGGDALTALFPATRARRIAAGRAVQCGLDMQAAMGRFRSLDTRAGRFRLTCKAGVAAGRVLTLIVGDPDVMLEYVIGGEAVERAVGAEHRADAGDVVGHRSILELCPDAVTGPPEGDFARVAALGTAVPHALPRPLPTPSEEAARNLAAFLHPAVADRIRTGHGPFVDEHRRISVLFVGFDGLGSDELATDRRLQVYFSQVVRTIRRFDGHLRQIEMGDKGNKYIVLFGAPVAHQNDEARALRCALELRRLEGPRARVGIATGLTYCGDLGSAARREYAAVGDTVNVAARLMEAAEPGRILVAGAPSAEIEDAFTLERVEPIVVKGKSDSVPVALLDDAPPSPRRHEDLSYDLPMVGRDEQVEQAREQLVAAAGGEGRIIGVVGEAGIGKSRFVAELAASARELGFDVHRGACDAYGTLAPYFVWESVWRSVFALEPHGSPARLARDLAERLRELDDGLAERAPLLAPALNLPIPENELTVGLEPELRTELLRSLLAHCLRAAADRRPQLLLLDDCHWIDPLSLELLASLGRAVERARAAIVVAHRPPAEGDGPLAWARRLSGFAEIVLEALADDDLQTLLRLKVKHLFAFDDGLPEEVASQLVARADGNAFYLEEFVNLLRDRDLDPRDAAVVEAVELPQSLQSLALARLDGLTTEEQMTLKVASVVGRRFKAFWLWGAYPPLGAAEAVEAQLQRLTRQQLTALVRPEPELEYLFRHVVIRDAAYDTLSFALRRRLHERVGSFIESAYEEELTSYGDVLAYHFGESDNVDKQRVYFRRAGEAAQLAFANEAAVDYFERLLPLTSGSARSDALRALGEVRQLTGAWDEAEACFREALAVADQADDDLARARCRCSLGYLLNYRQSFVDAREWLEEAKETFERLDDQEWLRRTLEYLAFAAWQQSDYESSLAYSARHLALAREAGDAVAATMAIEQTGLVHWHRGEREAARAALEEALGLAEDAGYARGVIHAGNDLAGLYAEMGASHLAFERVRAAIAAAERIGYRHAIGVMVGNAGELFRARGDLEQARACAAKGFTIAAELRNWTGVATKVGNMALALDEGETAQAERLLDGAIELARLTENPYFLCEFLHHRAQLLRRFGRPGEAHASNDEALEIARRIERRDVRLPAELLAVRLGVERGQMDVRTAQRSLTAFRDLRPDDAERAAIAYELWRLVSDEAARTEAADAYRTLYAYAPTVEYRKRYARLTGEDLPRPAPLPPLVEDPAERQVNVDWMLDRTSELTDELRASRSPVAA